ncbi:Sulfur carrier protein TusA [subsurface metagenome]
MDKKSKIKEIGISKRKMFFKFVKLFMYRIVKRKWVIPAVSEISVDQLKDQIDSNLSPKIIDVRDRREFNGAEGSYRTYGHIPNATCIPIMELSAKLENLSSFKDSKIVTICPGGGMSLIAAEILNKAEFKDVKSLTGGMDLWHKKGYPTTKAEDIIYPHEDINHKSLNERAKIIERKQSSNEKSITEVHKILDARNLTCPLPILKSRKALKAMKINQVLEIITTDPASKNDIPAWVNVSGQELISVEEKGPRNYRFLVRRLKSPLMN